MSDTVRLARIPEVEVEYDLFIAALGFETRARFVAETVRPSSHRRCALAFSEQTDLAFHQNRIFFEGSGFAIYEEDDVTFGTALLGELQQLTIRQREVRVVVDVSSFTRFRLAKIVEILSDASVGSTIVADFVYAIAVFNRPRKTQAPNATAGPVTPRFAGWSVIPDCATVLLVGVGYEPDRALGAAELLEPARIWAFVPYGAERQYDAAVEVANKALWARLPDVGRIRYDVLAPLDCFIVLESMTARYVETARPVLLPFGPKIFSVVCFLVGLVHDTVAVWRVSPATLEPPADRQASGVVTGVRALFGGPELATEV